MNTTTLLEVMAEVGRSVNELAGARVDVDDTIDSADSHIEDAFVSRGDERRRALKMAATMTILALYAHDAEAAKETRYDDHG